jgi:HEAT repeat protein
MVSSRLPKKSGWIKTAGYRMAYVFSRSKVLAETIKDRRYVETGLIAVGSGPNGDPLVYNRKTKRVGYLSHDVIWEDEGTPLPKAYQELPVGLAEHLTHMKQNREWPCDFYDARDFSARMSRSGTTTNETAKMFAAFDVEGEAAPRAALKRLVALGDQILPELLAAAGGSPRIRIRRWALEGIAKFADRRVRPVLLAALTDDAMTIRLHAIHALVVRGDRRAGPQLCALLSDISGGIRVNAAQALGTLRIATAGPALVRALKDQQWYVRQTAAWALGEVRYKPAAKALRRLHDDERKAVRVAAKRALAHMDVTT